MKLLTVKFEFLADIEDPAWSKIVESMHFDELKPDKDAATANKLGLRLEDSMNKVREVLLRNLSSGFDDEPPWPFNEQQGFVMASTQVTNYSTKPELEEEEVH